MTRLERQDPNLGADFFQRRLFFRVQGRSSIIAAFDINGGTHLFEQTGGANLRECDDMVYASERGDDLRPIGLAIQRPVFAFERPHGFITVDRHGERVPQGARGLEITDVSRMQEIEAPIRQDKPLSLVAQLFRDDRQLTGC